MRKKDSGFGIQDSAFGEKAPVIPENLRSKFVRNPDGLSGEYAGLLFIVYQQGEWQRYF